jgi:serine/threonine protein kinase
MMDRRATPLAGKKLKTVMYQLVDGINACHSRRIVHRDLNLRNILVTKDESLVKIADFGLSRAFQIPLHTYTHEVVTLSYRAPEILLGEKHYGPAVDIWSLGCILAELATKAPLFPGECEIQQLFLIFALLGTPTEESWPGVGLLPEYKAQFPQWPAKDLHAVFPQLEGSGVDLLRRMLAYNPKQRISANAALRHPWFDDVRPSPSHTPVVG